jgi:hypothetical protein
MSGFLQRGGYYRVGSDDGKVFDKNDLLVVGTEVEGIAERGVGDGYLGTRQGGACGKYGERPARGGDGNHGKFSGKDGKVDSMTGDSCQRGKAACADSPIRFAGIPAIR